MKKVYQTILGFPEGDCLPACVASILEERIEKIPKPTMTEDGRWDGWFERWTKIVAAQGIWVAYSLLPHPRDYCIRAIVTDHQDKVTSAHAVVWKAGKVIHDPHPGQIWKSLPEHRSYFLTVKKYRKRITNTKPE